MKYMHVLQNVVSNYSNELPLDVSQKISMRSRRTWKKKVVDSQLNVFHIQYNKYRVGSGSSTRCYIVHHSLRQRALLLNDHTNNINSVIKLINESTTVFSSIVLICCQNLVIHTSLFNNDKVDPGGIQNLHPKVHQALVIHCAMPIWN